MTNIATASVQFVAETRDVEPGLVDSLTRASSAVDDAATSVGRQAGRSMTDSMAYELGRSSRRLVRPLERSLGGLGAAFAGIGRAGRSALSPLERQTLRTGRGLSGLSRITGTLTAAFSDLGETASLALGAGRDNLRLLNAGIRQIGVSASEANSAFFQLGTSFRRFAQDPRSSLQPLTDRITGIGRSLARTNTSVLRATAVMSRAFAGVSVAAGAAAAVIVSLPAVASLAATTAAGAFAVGVAGIGIIAAAASEDVQETFVGLGEEIVEVFTGIAGPIEDALSDLADDLSRLTRDLAPSFEAGFATLGPSMSGFFDDITDSLRSFGPLIEVSSERFAELLDVLGPALGGAVERLAGALERLFRSSDSQFFTDTVVGIVDFTSALLDMITWLSSARSALMSDLAPALRALAPLFSGLWEGLSEAGGGVGRFAGEVFDQLIPAIDAMTPLFEDFGSLFEVAGRLVGGFFDDISPALAALTPFAEGFVEGFSQARDLIVSFFESLLDRIGPAGDALEDFATWVGENETVVRSLGVAIGTVVAFLSTYRIIALAVGVANTVLATTFRGVGVAIRSIPVIGWIIAGLALLVVVIQELWENSETFRRVVTDAWERVTDVFEAAWGTIQEVFGGLGEAWTELTGGIDFADTMAAAWDRLSDAFEAGWDVISGVVDAFQEGWANLVSGAQDSGVLAIIWDAVRDGAQTMWNVVGPIFDQLIETLEFIGGLVTGERGLSDLGELIGDWVDTLQGVGTEIAGFLIRQLERVPGLVISALSWFGETFGTWLFEQLSALPERAVEALSALPGVIAETVGSIPEQLADFLGVTDGWADWFAELGETAVTELAAVGVRIAEWFQELPGRVEGWLGVTDGWAQWFQDMAAVAVRELRDLGERIAEYMQGIPERVREAIGDGEEIIEWLRELPGRIVDFMRDYGPQILRGFATAITLVVSGIPALLLGLAASILFVLGVIAWELITWAGEAFGAMMLRAGTVIGEGIGDLVAWFQGLPDRLLAAVVGLGASLAAWATSAIARARSSFATALTNLRTWWDGRWSALTGSARTTWEGFTTWLSSSAGSLVNFVMEPINRLVRRMTEAFQLAVRNIGTVWNSLKEVIAAPINWMITTAYTTGIKDVWDKVATKFGGTPLPDAPPTVRFATGGVFPGYTPGRDVHRVPMAAFSGGESVLRPEVTKAWGARTTLMLNKLARTGGVKAVRRALAMLFSGQNPFTGMSVPAMASGPAFARGGVMTGAASRAWSWLSSSADDFAEGMADFLDDPKGVFKSMAMGRINFGTMPGRSDAMGKAIQDMVMELIELLAKQSEKLFGITAMGDWINLGGSVGGRLGAAVAFARAQAGKPYVWGGVGPRGFDCSGFMSAIHNVILGKNPYSRRYTTHSFVGTAANGFRRNFPSPFTIGNTHASVGHMAGTLLKMNVESRGSAGVVVGSRARGTTNPLFTSRWGLVTSKPSKGGRLGGEGILYDGGGWLPPGLTLTLNKTGRPEAIRTEAQEANVRRLVRLVQERIPAAHQSTPLVPPGRAGAFRRAVGGEVEGLGGATVVTNVRVETVAQDPVVVAEKVGAAVARRVVGSVGG